MENLFKKFFKGEAKLASTEWPPSAPLVGEEEEARKKLDGFKQRLEGLKLWMNDWTADDRMMAQRLEEEIATLEQAVSGNMKPEVNQPQETIRSEEDPEVKARIDAFTKKIKESVK